jgi:hypothetical protein
MRKILNIAVIGGSGFWADGGHFRHITEARESSNYEVKIVAIVDPIDPYKQSFDLKVYLQQVLQKDAPEWIKPEDYKNTSKLIAYLKDRLGVDLVVVASTPVSHYDYAVSCVKQHVHIICDKPIVSSRNSSYNVRAAKSINKKFHTLCTEYEKSLKDDPRLLCSSMLRRRGLDNFTEIADDLRDVYAHTGAGIDNMSVIVNGGKYLYPAELITGGAHGYLEGLGSLSHSAYHYIDLIAWYISSAKGNVEYLQPRLNYVLRVKDYMRSQSYMHLWELNSEKSPPLDSGRLSRSILESELNTSYTINLLNKKKETLGSIHFNFNQLSFSPRTLPATNGEDPGDLPGGGRMSNFIIDIHQSGLLNHYLYKNDTVFEPYNIEAKIRKHPGLASKGVSKSKSVDEPYDKGTTLTDAYNDLFSYLAGDQEILSGPVIRPIISERLTTELYGVFYELLAKPNTNKIIRIS